MRIQDDPTRRCWKVEEWPSIDRTAWARANAAGTLLSEDGLAAGWRPETRHKHRKGYGFWLHWLDRHASLDPAAEPADRVTPENIRTYIADLQSGSSGYTVRNRIAELLAVMRSMAPDRDWNWLRRTLRRLDVRARPTRDKRPLLRPSSDFLCWSLSSLRTLEAPDRPEARTAVAYRDALMIGLLTSRGLRRGNLSAMEIDRHLIPVGDGFRILFQSTETKTGHMLEQTVPDCLVPHLHQYLTRFRPLLLKDAVTNRLWVSQSGRPMSGMAVHHRVATVTRRVFGVAISPHLLRDCLATTIAIAAPEQIGLVKPLLHHRSSRTAEKHYNQAQSVETGRAYNGLLTELRKRIRRDRARQEPQSS